MVVYIFVWWVLFKSIWNSVLFHCSLLRGFPFCCKQLYIYYVSWSYFPLKVEKPAYVESVLYICCCGCGGKICNELVQEWEMWTFWFWWLHYLGHIRVSILSIGHCHFLLTELLMWTEPWILINACSEVVKKTTLFRNYCLWQLLGLLVVFLVRFQ